MFLHQSQSDWYKTTPHPNSSSRPPTILTPTFHSHSPTALASVFHFYSPARSHLCFILGLLFYLFFTLRPSLHCLFIYLRCLALPPLLIRFFPGNYPVMVASTRAKNKLAHPGAPVMTNAAKKKAGIKVKSRPRRTTRVDTIRELRARLEAAENPHKEPFTKEPLVRIGLSLCTLGTTLTSPSL